MDVVSVYLLLGLFGTVAYCGPTVNTDLGQVEGLHATDEASGLEYDAFYGIPYAEPPIGDLRFRKTRPGQPWTGVRNATEFAASCYQPDDVTFVPREDQSEDCLFMNIWVPVNVTDAVQRKLAVMLFIHGGGFSIGTGDLPGFVTGMRGLAIHGDVILITINYRLDVLGFLSTGDSNAPGNYALWDAIEALRFVQNNIANFGGDPERVTILGQSAGGVVVTQLMLSPKARGLFKRVISMSGSTFLPWAFTSWRKEKVNNLAEVVGCPGDSDTEAMLSCLRQLNASSLVDAPLIGKDVGSYWNPVHDGDLLPSPIDELLEDAALADIDFMGGSLATEGYLQAYVLDGLNRNDSKQFLQDCEDTFAMLYEDHQAVWQAAKFQYMWGIEDNVTALTRASWDLWHDMYFASGAEKIALSQARKGARVYSYDFNHATSFSPFPVGVHVEDLVYVFGDPIINSDLEEYTPEEVELSRNLVSYWSNFAKSGDPSAGDANTVKWDQYDPLNKQYLELKVNMTDESRKMKKRERQYTFWNDVILTIIKNCSK